MVDCYSPGQGLMLASFKVRTVPLDGYKSEEVLDPDFGESAIGRVAHVDSVLLAVSGVKIKITELHENYVVIISCFILVGLFSVQHLGTHIVAFMFAPILTIWLLCISGIGIYNIFRWNLCFFRALSPFYMFKFLRSTGIEGWISLGGVVLSIKGAESMFADLGHFSPLSIKDHFVFCGSINGFWCWFEAGLGKVVLFRDEKRTVTMSIVDLEAMKIVVVVVELREEMAKERK